VTTRTANLALAVAALLGAPLVGAAGVNTNGSEARKPAVQIFADARRAMLGAKNFHVLGSVHETGAQVSLNLSLSPGLGGGTIQLPGVTMQLVVSGGSVYIKADEKSWLKLTGSKPTAELVADRWIKASASDPDFSSFTELALSKSFMAQITLGTSAVSKFPATANWGGHMAVILTDNVGDRLYVVDGTTPYMLHIQRGPGAASGYITFSDFGSAPMPTIPVKAISFGNSS